MKQYKPFLYDLIKYHYNSLPENAAGGWLHVCLDDGNLDPEMIFSCGEDCERNGDTFGVFLSEVLLTFTTEELEEMYDKDWWGMMS